MAKFVNITAALDATGNPIFVRRDEGGHYVYYPSHQRTSSKRTSFLGATEEFGRLLSDTFRSNERKFDEMMRVMDSVKQLTNNASKFYEWQSPIK